MTVSWGPVTGIGSLPGTDPAEAVRLVVGELPGMPHLPELPGRGAGADMVGRTAGLLVDLAVDITPAGWRLVPRSGVDQRRAEEFLARDLDALHEEAEGYSGPLKLQAVGPWTMAASLERSRGERAVVDAGARRDLAQSLTEGLVAHIVAVAARVPGATIVVQLDEPSIPAVLKGGLPTASGFGRLPVVAAEAVEQELRAVIGGLAVPVVVHCCAPRMPLTLVRAAGAAGLSFDLGLAQDLDAVGEAVDAGVRLLVGVVPGTDVELPVAKATAARVQGWWRELGFPVEQLPDAVTLTPSCGLAGATPGYARAAMTHLREAARYLQPE